MNLSFIIYYRHLIIILIFYYSIIPNWKNRSICPLILYFMIYLLNHFNLKFIVTIIYLNHSFYFYENIIYIIIKIWIKKWIFFCETNSTHKIENSLYNTGLVGSHRSLGVSNIFFKRDRFLCIKQLVNAELQKKFFKQFYFDWLENCSNRKETLFSKSLQNFTVFW